MKLGCRKICKVIHQWVDEHCVAVLGPRKPGLLYHGWKTRREIKSQL